MSDEPCDTPTVDPSQDFYCGPCGWELVDHAAPARESLADWFPADDLPDSSGGTS